MKLDRELLLNIAQNSRLKITEEEVELFLPQLEEVMAVFESISKVDTQNIEPAFHPIIVQNIVREDVTDECLTTEEVFQDVKNKEEGFFKGPKAV
jgi:aspartyl-tRNA(Asn)/glutamyl-tRNA(Gln) amidotransferase subunit C